jgi:tetratricopeptide (TPR) repeat protein
MRPIALALAGLGEREAALRLIDRATALRPDDKRTEPSCRELRARMLTRFGDNDGAITLLADLLKTNYESYSGPPITPALLRLDPDFDSLRGDPRFEKLCQTITK